MKILMVDDNAELLISIKNALKGAILTGHCCSANEVVIEIFQNDPDILLLDHQLSEGGAEGFRVVEWVKKNSPKIEIVSTTKNDEVKKVYASMGIGWVDKSNLAELKKFIAEHTQ